MIELTEREYAMLELLANGASNKDLVDELGIALRTVELNRQRLMKKIGARSAAQLGYLYAKMTPPKQLSVVPAASEAKPSRPVRQHAATG